MRQIITLGYKNAVPSVLYDTSHIFKLYGLISPLFIMKKGHICVLDKQFERGLYLGKRVKKVHFTSDGSEATTLFTKWVRERNLADFINVREVSLEPLKKPDPLKKTKYNLNLLK